MFDNLFDLYDLDYDLEQWDVPPALAEELPRGQSFDEI
jgi:hypothetical protein